ncbi:DsbA family oxidoreductase [Microvirga sp. HBU67558]|uniref:DsbA family oxidoreductase n=1 Tax=Microvirga TaxID=186650 RepID=UPI001B37F563|nr:MULTISPECIES: DsbA family oxidoreductase [unclassified Microvirga]MBQ0821723.1 DsbA family oxidoreductase [Microvirga sp. HBU67558]
MTQHLKIDFVSDVACPWCVIGLRGLEQALANAADAVEADITFQPFELNPGMSATGQNLVEHIMEKYGSTAEQSAASRAMIRSRGAEVGFTFNMTEESRIYNTFDAHRLLHWAGIVGRQRELKLSLFKANFTDGANLSDHGVLVDAAVAAGLNGDEAREILASGRYAEQVRGAEREWSARGIRSVPAIVINGTWLISGGQPAGAFEQALRGIAAELEQASAGA